MGQHADEMIDGMGFGRRKRSGPVLVVRKMKDPLGVMMLTKTGRLVNVDKSSVAAAESIGYRRKVSEKAIPESEAA